MRRLFDSLAVRVALLFAAGILLVQATVFAVALWSDGQPVILRVIAPDEARAIVAAIEAVDRAQQPLIVAALNGRGTRVTLHDQGFEVLRADPRYRSAERLQRRQALLIERLDGRRVAYGVRRARGEGQDGPVRLLIALNTGQTLAIERVPVIWQRLMARYFTIALVIAAIVIFIVSLCLWYIVRPLSRLTAATHAFAADMRVADLPPSGPREIRTLATAFNTMKARITGLVDERTRMIAAVAHDLRTYLTRMRLRAGTIDDAALRARMAGDIEEMGQLIDDVVLFAAAQARRQEAVPAINAAEEVRHFLALRVEMGDDARAGTIVEGARCRCAPIAFRRILANLTDNALRYGGSATIALAAGERISLSVSDDGPGVPDGAIASLTEPFERIEPSRGRATGGAGLGLAIVKALATQNDALLEITNRPEGGLCVRVDFLPVG